MSASLSNSRDHAAALASSSSSSFDSSELLAAVRRGASAAEVAALLPLPLPLALSIPHHDRHRHYGPEEADGLGAALLAAAEAGAAEVGRLLINTGHRRRCQLLWREWRINSDAFNLREGNSQ